MNKTLQIKQQKQQRQKWRYSVECRFPKKIKMAADRCRKAFKDAEYGSFVWCCHHTIRIEKLTELNAEVRIRYILMYKNESEKVVRLNNFRPVKSKLSHEFIQDYAPAWSSRHTAFKEKWGKKLASMHRKDVPNHTFKRGSIF